MDGTRDGYVICSAPERRIASLYPTTTNRLVRRFDAALIAELRNNLPAIIHALKVLEAAEGWRKSHRYLGWGASREAEEALVRAVKGEQP